MEEQSELRLQQLQHQLLSEFQDKMENLKFQCQTEKESLLRKIDQFKKNKKVTYLRPIYTFHRKKMPSKTFN